MTFNRRFLPSPRRVVVVAPPGGLFTGVFAALEAFQFANLVLQHAGREPLYETVLAGLEDATASLAGHRVCTTPLAQVGPLHTLFVGGGPALPERPIPPALLEATAPLADRAERIVASCGGAFVLAELGLLDGRRCTTHWLHTDALQARVPSARVEPDAIFTHDGPVWTSAGATAALDLALQLIHQDGGARLARAVAQVMVVFVQRPGGQSQFSSSLRLSPTTGERFRALIQGIHREPAADHRVEALATRMGMSPRHFARVFRTQTGSSPAALVTRIRVEAAQRALASSGASVAEVARDTGFGTEETLRRSFQRVLGVTPRVYRERFA